MRKLRTRSQSPPITGPEVKPKSSQISPLFCSPLPSSFSITGSSLASSSQFPRHIPSPPSSQGDFCKTEIRTHHFSAQNPSASPDRSTPHHASLPSTTAPAHLPTTVSCQQSPTHSVPPTLLPSSSLGPQSSFLPQDFCTFSPFRQRCSSRLCTAHLSALSLSYTSSETLSWLFNVKNPHDLHNSCLCTFII